MALNYVLIGRRVKEIREQKFMTQVELAEHCRTTAQYLSQIEHGKKQPSLQTLVGIAETLDISIDELLGGNQVRNRKIYQNELGQLLEDCSSYEKRVIYELVKDTKRILRMNKILLEREMEYL